MIEGPFKEASYYYPGEAIEAFLQKLPPTEALDNQYMAPLRDRIVVMTHDDIFDEEMYAIEKALGFSSTWFLLVRRLDKGVDPEADVQLHFNKEAGMIAEQIESFRAHFGKSPIFNRTHRLLWRGHNLDFPLLAIHGIVADTTLIGTRPFRPTIDGRVLPIWEIPFCISDRPKRFMALYSIAGDNEIPFRCGSSPIVVLSHPFEVCERSSLSSCFHDVIRFAQRYGYRMIDLTTFYDQFLKGHTPQEVIPMEAAHIRIARGT